MKLKNLILSILCAVFALSSAFGQDMIVKRNAEEIEANVEEVNDTQIKYRRFSNPTGPVYSISKNEVLMIKYENGEKDVFTEATTPAQTLATTPVSPGKMTSRAGNFFLDGRQISIAEAKDLSIPYAEAIKHIRTGQGIYTLSIIMAIGGGGLLGWQLGAAIAGRDISIGGLVAGVLVTGGAFGIGAVTVAQYKKAAAAYNLANGIAGVPDYDIRLAVQPTVGGIGLALTF